MFVCLCHTDRDRACLTPLSVDSGSISDVNKSFSRRPSVAVSAANSEAVATKRALAHKILSDPVARRGYEHLMEIRFAGAVLL
jgi:hypothetical protein